MYCTWKHSQGYNHCRLQTKNDEQQSTGGNLDVAENNKQVTTAVAWATW